MTMAPPARETFERVLGVHGGTTPGPTLMVCGGIHGNEPAGALAAQRVLAALADHGVAVRGSLVAIAGNLEALSADRRFVEHDLNRAWTHERVTAFFSADDGHAWDAEDAEQRDLLDLFEEHRRRATGDVTILDLHTTSAGGPPFCIFSDTLENRRVAMQLGVPAILGLEECIDGTLLDYATKTGLRALVVEGGQHRDPLAVTYHEAAIWMTLVTLGVVDAADVPDLAEHRQVLQTACEGLPRVLEVRYRHPVCPADHFRMQPGFRGFDRVSGGQVIAEDVLGDIAVHEDSRLLMPLYQEQGEDGFFLIRVVQPFWLGVSALMRRVGIDRLVPLLPGVKRHPVRRDCLVVSRRTARFYTVEIFHLLGFRTRELSKTSYVFAKRRRQ